MLISADQSFVSRKSLLSFLSLLSFDYRGSETQHADITDLRTRISADQNLIRVQSLLSFLSFGYSGSETKNVVPTPTSLSTQILPLWPSTIFLTMDSPSPVLRSPAVERTLLLAKG